MYRGDALAGIAREQITRRREAEQALAAHRSRVEQLHWQIREQARDQIARRVGNLPIIAGRPAPFPKEYPSDYRRRKSIADHQSSMTQPLA